MMRWMDDHFDKVLLAVFAALAFFAVTERRLGAAILLVFVLAYFFIEMGWGGGSEFDWHASQRRIKNKLKFGQRHKRSGRPR